MKSTVLKVLVTSLLIFSLVGCRTATSIDLIHPETNKLQVTTDVISDEKYEEYQVEGTIFIPYINRNPKYYDLDYSVYSLRLATYQLKESSNKVKVNKIKIVGNNQTNFEGIIEEESFPLAFTKDEETPSIQVSDKTLIEKINNHDLKLSEESIINVIINVTVEVDGKTITKDLSYDFETLIRTYAVQR